MLASKDREESFLHTDRAWDVDDLPVFVVFTQSEFGNVRNENGGEIQKQKHTLLIRLGGTSHNQKYSLVTAVMPKIASNSTLHTAVRFESTPNYL